MTAQEKEIQKLIHEPEVCISKYDLKYIYEDDLTHTSDDSINVS